MDCRAASSPKSSCRRLFSSTGAAAVLMVPDIAAGNQTQEEAVEGHHAAFLAAAAATSRPALADARVAVDDNLIGEEEADDLAKTEAEALEKVSVDIAASLAVAVRRASVERALRGIIIIVFLRLI